jgi:tRNA (guanosine-2'-O-)-methyltransferase
LITTKDRRKRVESVLKRKQPSLIVVLENIHDPHNVGAIFRTCDSVGVMEVHLVYTSDAFPEISKESSVSASKWIKIVKHKSFKDCSKYLKFRNFKIAASHLEIYSKTHDEIDFNENVALVFGNEHRGITGEYLKYCDFSFRIPMHGMVQSLNVSVAAAICLYEAERHFRAAGKYNSLQLENSFYDKTLKEWLLK